MRLTLIRTAPRHVAPTVIGLLALVLVACSSTPSVTPLASGAEPPANCPRVEDGVLDFSAQDLAFSAPCMVAVAGEAFTIHFVNNDTQPHNVALFNDSSKANEIMRGDIITTQGEALEYEVEALTEGQYYFDCSVHVEMTGTLYVVPADG
jgi:plastocyanin